MPKTDPRPVPITVVGELVLDITPAYADLTVTAVEGGTVLRADIALTAGDVTAIGDVLAFTPTTTGGTVTLLTQQAGQEFSGAYTDLEGVPPGGGGGGSNGAGVQAVLSAPAPFGITGGSMSGTAPLTRLQATFNLASGPFLLSGFTLSNATSAAFPKLSAVRVLSSALEELYLWQAGQTPAPALVEGVIVLPAPVAVTQGGTVLEVVLSPGHSFSAVMGGTLSSGLGSTAMFYASGAAASGDFPWVIFPTEANVLGRLPAGGMRVVTDATPDLSNGDVEIVAAPGTAPVLRMIHEGIEYALPFSGGSSSA